MRGDETVLAIIAERLEKVRRIDERGHVSYEGWETDEVEAILFSVEQKPDRN